MSEKHSYGLSGAMSQHRHHTMAHVEFTATANDHPADATVVDRAGVLRVATPRIERLGEGRYRLHLRNDWKNIGGNCCVLSTTATHQCRPEARSVTAGSCSFDIRSAIADTADDLETKVHLVDLHLSNSDDF